MLNDKIDLDVIKEIVDRSNNLLTWQQSNNSSINFFNNKLINALKNLKKCQYPLLGIMEHKNVNPTLLEKPFVISNGAIILGKITVNRWDQLLNENGINPGITFEVILNKNANKATENDKLRLGIDDKSRRMFLSELKTKYCNCGFMEKEGSSTDTCLSLMLVGNSYMDYVVKEFIELSLQYCEQNENNKVYLELNLNLEQLIKQAKINI